MIDYLEENIWLYFLLLTFTGFVLGVISYYLIRKTIHSSFELENKLIDSKLKTPFYLAVALFVIKLFYGIIKFDEPWFSTGSKVIFVLLVIAIASLFYTLLELSSIIIENKISHNNKQDNLHERKILTQYTYVKRLVFVLLGVLTISIIFLSFEEVRKIGISLLASAGVTGIIIGLAAQKTISNLLAGFQIAFTQPIRIDDVVIIEKEWGRVEEMTLTYIVIKIWDERRMIVPLSYFIEKPFQNWTRTKAELLGNVTLWVDYACPVDPIREEAQRLVENHSMWDKRVVWVQVVDTSEKGMQVRILVSASTSAKAFDLRCDVREGLIKFLQTNYPQSFPKLRVDTLANFKEAE